MAYQFKNRRGFSFMELIIVIAIIMIMTVVMLVMSMRDREKKKFEAAGREVAAAVREAQNNALTGKQKDNNSLPCAMMFYTDSNEFSVVGSFRTLDSSCGSDTDIRSYAMDSPFMASALSPRNLKMQMYNYDEDADSGRMPARDKQFIIFTVPYGKYIDNLGVRPGELNSTSRGTEIHILDITDTASNPGKMFYRICVHPTGLIEDMGIIEPGDANAVGKVCLFKTI